MHVAISEADRHLTDLVRRAEAGEEVVLTRHGRPVVQLVVVERSWTQMSVEERRVALNTIWEEGRRRGPYPGPSVREIQNALNDDLGISD